MDYKKEYERWLEFSELDERLKAELILIRNNDDEIFSRFYTTLNFGTAGLRGLMGVGTNRMNVYTVRQATYALGKYICDLGEGAKQRGVVIAFDSRNNGVRFAEDAALTLCSLGIKVYIFDSLRPTPELSFAIRKLGAIAGVNVTASHNPKEYNGYKVYFEDGAQIAGEQADIIFNYMSGTDPLAVRLASKSQSEQNGLYNVIGAEIDDAYVNAVLLEKLDIGKVSESAKNVSIVYSAFHGAGYKLVPRVLKEIGANVTLQPDQAVPNGDFPTLKSPNPEELEGMELSIKLAKQIGSDLVIATDPDADRCAIAVIMSNGDVEMLSGNQIGVLLCDFIVTILNEQNKMPKNPAVVSTIVSTLMIKQVCAQNNIDYFEVLTGFKYIGECIASFEKANNNSFLLGFEESYGYLKGNYARDKDAVVAAMLITQMAMYFKNKGFNLKQALDSLYKKYGYFVEKTLSYSISGAVPMEQVDKIMTSLRNQDNSFVASTNVLRLRDYKNSTITNIKTGEVKPTNLPVSNVLYYEFEDGCSVIVRPSGTEPKIKLYILTSGENKYDCNEKLKKYQTYFSQKLQ